MSTRALFLALFLVAALAGLLVADAIPTGLNKQASDVPQAAHPIWTEVKWPFPLDQWGIGRAFVCRAADCGGEVNLYVRPKLGFCNCATGVSDDAELDRVGDLELLSPTFDSLSDGRPIAVGWMSGRSRPYHVAMRYGASHSMTNATWSSPRSWRNVVCSPPRSAPRSSSSMATLSCAGSRRSWGCR